MAPGKQPRPELFAWSLVVMWTTDMGTADPCCFRTIDPDTALSSSADWDFIMASGGSAGYSHQTVLHHPHLSSLSSLHNTQSFCSSPITLSYLLAGFYSILPIEGKIWPAVSRMIFLKHLL